jgi:hypothetical protein
VDLLSRKIFNGTAGRKCLACMDEKNEEKLCLVLDDAAGVVLC